VIPQIDKQIGISVYSTNCQGIGGKIRVEPEDFQVKERISEKIEKNISEQDGYSVYKLTKKKIDTNHALSEVFRVKGIRLKSLGLKDASAITEQFVCSESKGKGIEEYNSDRVNLKRLGYLKKPLSKKDMIGNHFEIKITDSQEPAEKFSEFEKILNFYGYQRFGSKRPVTHLIGKAIVQKDFAKAVELIVSFTSEFDSTENTEIREKLRDKANYSKYIQEVPSQMDIERIVISEMIQNDDPLKAIRAIPISLRRFYVQAYQSFIFNKTLSMAFEDGEELFESQEGDICYDKSSVIGKFIKGLDQVLAIPFVGYSYYKKTRFDYQISKILEEEEISFKDFYIKEMQEVSNEGGFRQAAINCTNYYIHENKIQFTLSRGSFATMVLREIMKPVDPIGSGF
jgi:tRNA pseudouridine13 synthase